MPSDFDTPRSTKPFLPPPVPDPTPTLDMQLPDRIAQLQAEIDRLETEGAALRKAMKNDLQAAKAIGQSHTQSYRKVRDTEAKRKAILARIATLKSAIKRKEATMGTLRIQYDEARRQSKKAVAVRHKITPVGVDVVGKEIHFRLVKGRVSHVPIEKLVKQMRNDVLRRKDWLMKTPSHSGIAGPVAGYTMNYVVQRQLTSRLDELRGGYGQIRIVLAGWKVQTTSELVTESTEQAVRPGSRFLRELRAADSDATVTFWVYPDSFSLYRELQKIVQEDGLRVAARPLPFGIPIAGSPNGSRSSGQ